jgi:hypothetical protein
MSAAIGAGLGELLLLIFAFINIAVLVFLTPHAILFAAMLRQDYGKKPFRIWQMICSLYLLFYVVVVLFMIVPYFVEIYGSQIDPDACVWHSIFALHSYLGYTSVQCENNFVVVHKDIVLCEEFIATADCIRNAVSKGVHNCEDLEDEWDRSTCYELASEEAE